MNKFLEFVTFEFNLCEIIFNPIEKFYLISLCEFCNEDGFQSSLFKLGFSRFGNENNIYFDILYFKMFKRMTQTFLNCE